MYKYHIAICTVNFDYPNLVHKNLSYLAKNNPDIEFTYIIGNNVKYPHTYENYDNVTLQNVPGVKKRDCIMKIEHGFTKKQAGRSKPGLHHSGALDNALKHAESQNFRFIATLDQDFFYLLSLSKTLDYMVENKIDILGAEYAWGGWHYNNKMSHISNVASIPSCFFTIFNAHNYNNITTDLRSRQRNKYKQELLDTSITIRERVHQYKQEAFATCIKKNCSICNQVIPTELPYDKMGYIFERYIFDNKLCGMHFHAKNVPKKNLAHAPVLVENIDKVLYYSNIDHDIHHPLSNFVMCPTLQAAAPVSIGKGIK